MRITDSKDIDGEFIIVWLNRDWEGWSVGMDKNKAKAYEQAAKRLRKLADTCERRAKRSDEST